MDQSKSFWVMHETKLLKGRIEAKLSDLSEGKDGFEVYTCHPFGILEATPPLVKSLVFPILPSVKAVELAAAMLDLGLRGSNKWIWENDDIGQRSAHLLE